MALTKRKPLVPIATTNKAFRQSVTKALAPRINYLTSNGKTPNGVYTNDKHITQIFDLAFWASLATEEGRSVKGTICLATPNETFSPLLFEKSEPFELKTLVHLFTASPSGFVGVQQAHNGKLEMWGLGRRQPAFSIFLSIVAPGIVHVYVDQPGDFPFLVGIAHDGQLIVPNDPSPGKFRDILVTTFKPADPDLHSRHLLDIITAMCAHKHGGMLVMVDLTSSFQKNMKIRFPFSPETSQLLKAERKALAAAAAQLNQTPNSTQNNTQIEQHFRLTASKVRKTLDRVGQLSAIDGALVLGEDFTLYGFGAKLTPPHDPNENKADFQVIQFDALHSIVGPVTKLSKIGGTRHQSAARFVQTQHKCVAFVASQDGGLSMFGWNHDKNYPAAVFQMKNLEHFGAFL